ncbi:enterotoxin [Geothrix limicola]|uniref:Enterotoxin n=1 Tax=Geothrix limicola TaxID=2927978 RepID=A0ABQ5QKW2_9BACT|nr:hypothetical protein [Geothrix limicola]GLH74940.1 enterotoxin [Geothrix limicola]
MIDYSIKTSRLLSSLALGLILGSARVALGMDFPGPNPGKAVAAETAGQYLSLSNHALSASWAIFGGRLVPATLKDKLSGRDLEPAKEAFVLEFHDGTRLKASRMKASSFKVRTLAAQPGAVGEAGRIPGQQVSAVLMSTDDSLRVEWKATLRDGSNYIRQEILIQPLKGDADLARLVMVDHWLRGADVTGQVNGSPVVAGTLFTGFEHPMSVTQIEAGGAPKVIPAPGSDEGSLASDQYHAVAESKGLEPRWGKAHATSWLDLSLPIQKGKTFQASSVLGVVPQGQLRRGFLYYVERERAHAYRTFLHYNSWYDIGYFTPYDEKDCLKVVKAFDAELVQKRGVKLDSFLFDDGWDDTSKGGQWVFHKGFPRGFTAVKEAAEKAGAEPGVWLSPWGGYGPPRVARRKSGQAAGYEVVSDPWEADPEYGRLFALSGPKYYESFHKACLEMVTKYGINHFKLDGTGSINAVMPGSRFGSDFEAAISLIQDLRQAKPGLFINLTTGTWPSPFWLPICDSIWRGGEDHSFEGAGSDRERWITYRDADTFERIVSAGPLYPLNSLMLHGILYAKGARGLNADPGKAFTHEVRSYFGSGTQLQEMYISHELLQPEDWDALAEGAKWSRANAATLVDTHWVGGNPRKLEVYGWASWSPEKGILTLRNPSSEAQTFTLDLAKALELPEGAADAYAVKAAFKQRELKELVGAQNPYKPVKVVLRPFEVLVFEALPLRK